MLSGIFFLQNTIHAFFRSEPSRRKRCWQASRKRRSKYFARAPLFPHRLFLHSSIRKRSKENKNMNQNTERRLPSRCPRCTWPNVTRSSESPSSPPRTSHFPKHLKATVLFQPSPWKCESNFFVEISCVSTLSWRLEKTCFIDSREPKEWFHYKSVILWVWCGREWDRILSLEYYVTGCAMGILNLFYCNNTPFL